ncbi:hypothetical protein CEN49_01260 [Fischerella thermalis CCMEE 5273]|uniref:Uncharacterized protein n=1 Tax=Chlorogloeopsis fritschii PCC 6912 TaxID=211165 RepID=A0A433NLN9_CHLFR|nr:hypothetical protein [Chlorogloeopsis fritschii]PMB11645.1 hypothetical protein CEN49_01260 [Fischerella thermalis CCMEE 5273]PMB46191.1 hypothetical protein CEN40_10735 [Fischerella thermalis CCMEE 5205]RUR83813.1 hypothetical protein PCC6912_20560 [Chlorogloeopsis fritschii PCC 6912]
MNYIAIIEGQQVPIPEETASNDEKIRLAISTYFPEYANAEITRTTTGDTTEIRLVKRAGTKGNCITELKLAPEQINPAFELAWKLKLLEIKNQLPLELLISIQAEIIHTIKVGESWEIYTEKVSNFLKQQPSIPSIYPVL